MEKNLLIHPDRYSTAEFEAEYTYYGGDLGAVWTPAYTAFRVWAPGAEAVTVNLYRSGDPDARDPVTRLPMKPDTRGTWTVRGTGDLHGVYYTYSVQREGETLEAGDPYARAAGINGVRSMVIDLESTHPEGWSRDRDPHYGRPITDAVIYELHLRDLGMDESAGIPNPGKFLSLTHTGTRTPDGIPTGLDHIKSLGVTHVQLLPCFDFGSVDEREQAGPGFNWGYDPVNFNVPEGSYSTNPRNGAVRVAEFKQLVRALHENGLSVVMDVVYNHVYETDKFCFNRIVPMYFSRSTGGVVSCGSGCGNDTASERSMVRKYIVDSVKYWAEEYHIDGFRFDLAGLLDCQTIREVMDTVHADRPNVLFYGEGWTMDTRPTKPDVKLCTQENAELVPGFAFFNDTFRDVLKGTVFLSDAPGFVTGAQGLEPVLRRCFAGRAQWCPDPCRSINYVSCHDNLTLSDRITLSTPHASKEARTMMNRLAAAIYMTAQGVPFLQAGEELLRSKPAPEGGFVDNSYRSPDSVNAIRWSALSSEEGRSLRDYYRGLIAFRRAHSLLRLSGAEAAGRAVSWVEGLDRNVVAFHLRGGEEIFLAFNANPDAAYAALPEGEWEVFIDGQQAGTKALRTVSGVARVEGISALVLCREKKKNAVASGALMLGGVALGAALAGAAALLGRKRKK